MIKNYKLHLPSKTTIFIVGKQKLMQFSEGVKESLRRLSNITWMAEELHRVADFLLRNTSVSTLIYVPNSTIEKSYAS